MSATHTISVVCNVHPDGPPAVYSHSQAGGYQGARKAAKAAGWHGTGQVDICPDCYTRLAGQIVELDEHGHPKVDAAGESA